MQPAQPIARGIHHLALNTDDMKMTLDFYVGVLGMPLVHALKVPPGLGTGPGNRGNPPYENLRHYFLDAGGDMLLAFFEMPKGVKPRADRDAIGTMQHVSFAVSEDRFNEVKRKIEKAGLPYLGPDQRRLRHLVDLLLRPERHPPRVLAPEAKPSRGWWSAGGRPSAEALAELENAVAGQPMARNAGRAPARAPLDSRHANPRNLRQLAKSLAQHGRAARLQRAPPVRHDDAHHQHRRPADVQPGRVRRRHPGAGEAPARRDRRGRRRADRQPGVQLLAQRRAEKRHRLGLAPAEPVVAGQAGGDVLGVARARWAARAFSTTCGASSASSGPTCCRGRRCSSARRRPSSTRRASSPMRTPASSSRISSPASSRGSSG